jgi:putative ABC transport system permease protein
MEEYEAVVEACKHCKWVGAELDGSARVKSGEQSINNTNIEGLTPSMATISDIDLSAGRMINDVDMRNNTAVVVVGADIVDKLLAGMDPIDKEVRIDGWTYRVIGVGERKGTTLGQSMDNYALMPITAYEKQYGAHESIQISGKAADSGASFEAAMDEARAVLRARRHEPPSADDDFDIATNDSLMSMWSNISDTFFYAMIGIAAISLVVGGIVIMNIMLVSVTERTREIGIRKALGARSTDIMLQFLIESVTVALAGGAIGVLGGVSVAKTVTLIIGVPSEIKLWAVAAGLLVAASVGIFFGVYPARRAAKLDPIAALRYET